MSATDQTTPLSCGIRPQDPRIEAFSPKAHDLSQLKGLREFTHSSSASSFGATSGNFLSAPEDDYACYNPAYLQQYSNLQYDSCWDDQHSLLLQPAYLPAFNQQLALCSTALDMSACHQLPAPAVTPEHVHMAHLPRAELLMSPLSMSPNRFLEASLLSPQPPCARSWANTARAGGMSAPASPAGHTLFIGQPPPPPPRVSSVPPPPPPRPSPHHQTPLAPIQYDLTARVAALMSTSSSPPTPVHLGGCTSSSYGRLLQGAFGSGTREDPFLQAMPAPVRIGTSAVLGTDQHGSASAPSTSAGRDDLAAADVAHALPKLATDGSIGPITPTALLTAAGRRPLSGSRLSRSSSGTGSFHSCDSREASMGGAAPGPSRLSSSGAGQLCRMGSRASTSSPCASACVPGAGAPPIVPAPPAKPVRIPPAQLMYMEMHDPDCSAYCLGGNLEPHKMWFGVGVHRCAAGQFICTTAIAVCSSMHMHELHMLHACQPASTSPATHQAPSPYDLPCAALSSLVLLCAQGNQEAGHQQQEEAQPHPGPACCWQWQRLRRPGQCVRCCEGHARRSGCWHRVEHGGRCALFEVGNIRTAGTQPSNLEC